MISPEHYSLFADTGQNHKIFLAGEVVSVRSQTGLLFLEKIRRVPKFSSLMTVFVTKHNWFFLSSSDYLSKSKDSFGEYLKITSPRLSTALKKNANEGFRFGQLYLGIYSWFFFVPHFTDKYVIYLYLTP